MHGLINDCNSRFYYEIGHISVFECIDELDSLQLEEYQEGKILGNSFQTFNLV